MKKYRLKQWYPRIPVYLEDGYIISFDENKGIAIYEFFNGVVDTFEMSGAELECTQYWELVEEEEPLFVTEDGVEVYDIDFLVFAVKGDFLKIQTFALAFSQNKNDMKSFYHESNADEYILWNKPLLSLNEIDDTIEMYSHEFEELIKLARERIEG